MTAYVHCGRASVTPLRGHQVWMAKIRIVIRDARPDELGQVVRLWEKLVEHHSSFSPYYVIAPDGKQKWSRYLAQKFSEKSTKLIVAAENGEIVAFMLCLLSPNEPIFKDRTLGIISDVYVDEDRRRKGVAREMLRQALRWFKKNKVKHVQISVAANNIEGRAAWAQLGFKPFMLHKRLDLDKYPATMLVEQAVPQAKTRVVKKVVKKKLRRRVR